MRQTDRTNNRALVLIKAIKRDYSQFLERRQAALNGYIKERQYRYVSIEGTDMVIKEAL